MIRIVNMRNFLGRIICIFVCLATLALAVPQGLEGDEPSSPDDQQRGIWIEPRAEKLTAQFYIDGGVDGAEAAEENRKRTKYGIGESLTLTVAGKPNLIGDESEITWHIKDTDSMVTPMEEENLVGTKELKIVFKDSVPHDGTVVVTVTTHPRIQAGVQPQPQTAQITLAVIFPKDIFAKHIPANGQLGTDVPFSENDRLIPLAFLPQLVGTGMLLALTVMPTDVSFEGLHAIERDAGSPLVILPTGEGKTTLGKRHKPNVRNIEILETHYFTRDLARWVCAIPWLILQIEKGLEFPQQWQWKCNWNIVEAEAGDTDQGLISGKSYIQEFFCEATATPNVYKAKITKFGKSATRENTSPRGLIKFE